MSATMYYIEPGLTAVSHKKLLRSTPGKLLIAFQGIVAELEIKTQLFCSQDRSKDFRTSGPCSDNGKSCFEELQDGKMSK